MIADWFISNQIFSSLYRQNLFDMVVIIDNFERGSKDKDFKNIILDNDVLEEENRVKNSFLD